MMPERATACAAPEPWLDRTWLIDGPRWCTGNPRIARTANDRRSSVLGNRLEDHDRYKAQ
jgi:hypothetical protein